MVWILGTLGVGFLVLRAVENRFLYFPDREIMGTPRDVGLDFEDVRLAASDGVAIHAWHVRVPDAKAIVVHFHGNAGNVSGRVPIAAAFAAEGLETLLVDYRGYGRSAGSPSEEGLAKDADAAWEWAQHSGRRVVVYGESLGGAVAVDVASRREVHALVVQSSFTRLADMADRMFPFGGAIVSQKFDSIAKIAHVRAPVLVIHGDRDEIVPFEMGVRLEAAAHGQKAFLRLPGAHHNDVIERAGGEIARRVAQMTFYSD
jgi:hypothetical protein